MSDTLRALESAKQLYYKYPIIAFMLQVLFGGSAFMTGAFALIGFGFIPLVNKSDIIAAGAFYASIAAVLIRLLFLVIQYWLHIIRAAPDFYAMIKIILIPFIVITIIASVGLMFMLVTIETNIPREPVELGFEITNSPGMILLIAMIFFSLSFYGAAHYVPPPVLGIRPDKIASLFLTAARTFTAITIIFAGSVWVEFIRINGSTVDVTLVDSDAVRKATLLMPATQGVLLFWEDDARAHYVRLDDIKSVSGPYRRRTILNKFLVPNMD